MRNTQRGPDIANPEAFFGSPRLIVDAPEMTRGQKQQALDCWAAIVQARLNLARSDLITDGQAVLDLRLLQEIARARADVAAQFASVRGARRASV
jgi:hypothetical protein